MRIIFAVIVMLVAAIAGAQTPDPVEWTAKWSEPITKKGLKVFLVLTAKIGPNWHIYAMNAGDGVNSTKISIKPATKLFRANGDWILPDASVITDPATKESVKVYDDEVVFRIPLVILNPSSKSEITVQVSHQACSGEMCLRPVRKTLSLKFVQPKQQKATSAKS